MRADGLVGRSDEMKVQHLAVKRVCQLDVKKVVQKADQTELPMVKPMVEHLGRWLVELRVGEMVVQMAQKKAELRA